MLKLTRFRNRRIAIIQDDRIIAVIQNRTWHVDQIDLGIEAAPCLRVIRAELLPPGIPCEVGQQVRQSTTPTTPTNKPASAGGVSHGKAR